MTFVGSSFSFPFSFGIGSLAFSFSLLSFSFEVPLGLKVVLKVVEETFAVSSFPSASLASFVLLKVLEVVLLPSSFSFAFAFTDKVDAISKFGIGCCLQVLESLSCLVVVDNTSSDALVSLQKSCVEPSVFLKFSRSLVHQNCNLK